MEIEVLGTMRVPVSPGSEVAAEFSDSAGTSEVSSFEAVAEALDPARTPTAPDSDSVVMLRVVPYSVNTGFESAVGVVDFAGVPAVSDPGTVVKVLDSTVSLDSVAVVAATTAVGAGMVATAPEAGQTVTIALPPTSREGSVSSAAVAGTVVGLPKVIPVL